MALLPVQSGASTAYARPVCRRAMLNPTGGYSKSWLNDSVMSGHPTAPRKYGIMKYPCWRLPWRESSTPVWKMTVSSGLAPTQIIRAPRHCTKAENSPAVWVCSRPSTIFRLPRFRTRNIPLFFPRGVVYTITTQERRPADLRVSMICWAKKRPTFPYRMPWQMVLLTER